MKHGNYKTYKAGCRCEPCTHAAMVEAKAYRIKVARSGVQKVPADEARDRVKRLMRTGYRIASIARACGVASVTMYRLMDGQKLIHVDTSNKILALSRSDLSALSGGWVPSKQTWNMLNELKAAGFSNHWFQSQRLWLALDDPTPQVRLSTARRIKAIHDEVFVANTQNFRDHCKCMATNPSTVRNTENKRRNREAVARCRARQKESA